MTEGLAIPDGWRATTLGELGEYLNGRAFKKNEWGKSGRPIIRIQDLTGSHTSPNFFDDTVEDRYVVRPGDFLISWAATLGAYIWEGPEGVLNQHIFKVRSNIEQRFHYHLVRESLAELSRNAHGSGMVHITKGAFENTPVAVPTSPEKQRQLSDLIDHSDQAHATVADHVDAAAELIRTFRQTVRVAACTGRLTDDWRDAHPDAQSVEEALGTVVAKKRTKASAAPLDLPLPDLPDSYLVSTIGQAATTLEYGTSKKCGDDARQVPVLRMGNITDDGLLKADDLKYASKDAELKRLMLEDGDLLFNRTNSAEKVGKTAVFHDSREMSFASYLIRVRLHPNVADADFVNLWLNSAWGRRWARHVKTDGVSQSNINGTKLGDMSVPLPPIEEQREIVARAKALLAIADDLGGRIDAANSALGRSAQAVLAKAFRGELSPGVNVS